MSDFYRTGMGHKFYEGTMPELVRQLTRLNDNLENAARLFVKPIRKDHEIIQEILRILSGTEWEASTLDDIAGLLNSHGYKIEEPPR